MAVGAPRQTLKGRVVLVTRPQERADHISVLLRVKGALPIDAPTIEVMRPRAREKEKLLAAILGATGGAFAWVIFTSPAAVDSWFRQAPILRPGEDARPRSLVAAVGTGTARALRENGVEPDLIPPSFTTKALAAAFPLGTGAVLLPRADIAPRDLEDALREKGWTPKRVEAYRTRIPRSLPAEARNALKDGLVDAIAFSSASTVKGFVHLAGLPEGPKVVCMGPVTAQAAREAGFLVDAVARPHTVEGLLAALERVLR
jgi:uroporphyrinogen-III synthase